MWSAFPDRVFAMRSGPRFNSKAGLRRLILPVLLVALFGTQCDRGPAAAAGYDDSISDLATPGDALPHFRGPDMQPFWPDQTLLREDPDLRQMQAFEATNQSGITVRAADLRGHISVVSFFFATCVGICPRIVRNLLAVQDHFGAQEEVRLYSFSVTPEVDTTEVLSRYASRHGIRNTQWDLLRGQRSEIYTMARRAFNADTVTPHELRVGMSQDDFLHSGNVYLLDRDGYLRGIYNGFFRNGIDELILDIERLREQ
ncbi:MAG: SCO family protein [Leptospiraceae bacterium]|nr:SCO family protein [Leptospiraceae bacterium]